VRESLFIKKELLASLIFAAWQLNLQSLVIIVTVFALFV